MIEIKKSPLSGPLERIYKERIYPDCYIGVGTGEVILKLIFLSIITYS